MAVSFIDPNRSKWREVTGPPDATYKFCHEYTILGHSTHAGTPDMMARWNGDGGHCRIHRHVATTTVLVIEGEQHLSDLHLHPDASRGDHRVRHAGDYALRTGDDRPRLERGGDDGGLVF